MPEDPYVLRLREDAHLRRLERHRVHSVIASAHQVADTIEAVEREGWRLDHLSAYGTGLALLVFRLS
ncbi:hypothetical protein ACIBCA_09200 [Kitasatospora sp. NPDC051170]|uniref:hypothetical protein n=1 Tax=Kitasatospora sp. NPDC051170 TaxID=3364056 RepID=UPI0037ADA7C3